MSPKCQQTNNLLNLVVTQVPLNWQLAILFEPTCQETVYLLKLVVIENARYWQLIETSCAMKKITFNSLTHKNDVIFWSLLQHISEHCWRKIFFALQKHNQNAVNKLLYKLPNWCQEMTQMISNLISTVAAESFGCSQNWKRIWIVNLLLWCQSWSCCVQLNQY